MKPKQNRLSAKLDINLYIFICIDFIAYISWPFLIIIRKKHNSPQSPPQKEKDEEQKKKKQSTLNGHSSDYRHRKKRNIFHDLITIF